MIDIVNDGPAGGTMLKEVLKDWPELEELTYRVIKE